MLSRSAVLRRLLVTLPIAPLTVVAPPPARALLGEVVSSGFTQSDDKSWDFTLPNPAWSVTAGNARAEHPKRIFHVMVSGPSGSGAELTVDPLKGARGLADLGAVKEYGEKSLLSQQPPQSELLGAEVVPGSVKGSKYYAIQYKLPAGVIKSYRITAKQGRVYSFAVSTPSSPSATLEADAQALLTSFKAFPVNIICITQSDSGTAPVPGSCY